MLNVTYLVSFNVSAALIKTTLCFRLILTFCNLYSRFSYNVTSGQKKIKTIPGITEVTPSPTLSTTAAASCPRTQGKRPFKRRQNIHYTGYPTKHENGDTNWILSLTIWFSEPWKSENYYFKVDSAPNPG